MPKAVVCRELGPPERLRLESFAAPPLEPGAGAGRHPCRWNQIFPTS